MPTCSLLSPSLCLAGSVSLIPPAVGAQHVSLFVTDLTQTGIRVSCDGVELNIIAQVSTTVINPERLLGGGAGNALRFNLLDRYDDEKNTMLRVRDLPNEQYAVWR